MTLKSQKGMTMWSAMFVIGVAAFFLFLLFKLLPAYLEDWRVRTALDGLARESGVEAMAYPELVGRLGKRFDIDSVTGVKASQLKVQPQGRSRVLRFTYEVVVPLAYNVSALLEFDHARQISAIE